MRAPSPVRSQINRAATSKSHREGALHCRVEYVLRGVPPGSAREEPQGNALPMPILTVVVRITAGCRGPGVVPEK